MNTEPTTPDSAPAEPKKPRRRFTPEERIANRKAEIERIEEKQRAQVRATIELAGAALRDCMLAARAAGMAKEVKLCADALDALTSHAQARTEDA